MLGSSGTTVARQREGESAPPCSDDVAHGRAFAQHQAARAALLKQRQLLGSGSKLEAQTTESVGVANKNGTSPQKRLIEASTDARFRALPIIEGSRCESRWTATMPRRVKTMFFEITCDD